MSSPACVQEGTPGIPPDAPGNVFLDTSIFCAKFKHPELAAKIEDVVGRFNFVGTSSLVKLEYGRVILKELKYILTKLKSGESVQDIVYRIAHRIPQPFNSNKMKWLCSLLSRHFGKMDAKERLSFTLEELLICGTEEMDWCTDNVSDGLACPFAVQTGDWRNPSGCEKLKSPCRIADFFVDHKDTFTAIGRAAHNAWAALEPPEQEKRRGKQLRQYAEVINRALVDPSILRNKKACRSLGDAMIAVQSKDYEGFFTQNFLDSRIFCRVTRQLLLELQQDLAAPVTHSDYRDKTLVTS